MTENKIKIDTFESTYFHKCQFLPNCSRFYSVVDICMYICQVRARCTYPPRVSSLVLTYGASSIHTKCESYKSREKAGMLSWHESERNNATLCTIVLQSAARAPTRHACSDVGYRRARERCARGGFTELLSVGDSRKSSLYTILQSPQSSFVSPSNRRLGWQ